MRLLVLCAALAATPLAACQDAEVTEAEAPVAVDPVDTGSEVVTTDPPVGTSAGWDTNNDGNFDRNEFTGYRDTGFLGWDDDKDTRLSRTEFEAGWAEAGWRDPGTAFTAFDDNADTFLSDDEFFGEDEFSEWDKNANGVLERGEWNF
ncbi:hypothetical protein ABVV53_10760 [Novosphingobium sp. RD2P27]|uniref:EF-hand domain-containing protein n=1 Tax=Novosphingobium kalidii TaxID=3230299 RepID=A0ABV2D3S0_9SPHN